MPAALRELRRCRLLDVVVALVPLNGVTLTVAAADEHDAAEWAGDLPAGVDLVVSPSPPDPAGRSTWVIRWHLARGFGRVLLLADDALPVPARTAATGLSVLARADLVLGPTPAGGLYLVGARDDRGAILAGAAEATVASLETQAVDEGMLSRRLEPRRRLADLPGVADFRLALPEERGGAPCLHDWLDRLGGLTPTSANPAV